MMSRFHVIVSATGLSNVDCTSAPHDPFLPYLGVGAPIRWIHFWDLGTGLTKPHQDVTIRSSATRSSRRINKIRHSAGAMLVLVSSA